MAGIPYKNGLNPVTIGGSSKLTGAIEVYQTSAAAGAIFTGDPVYLNANGLVEAGITPTSTTNCVGVAVGGFWIDPTTSQPVESKFIPANTSSANGTYNGVNFTAEAGPGVKVVSRRDQLFAVKALASVAQTFRGDRIDLETAAGSTITGQTGTRVEASANPLSPVIVQDVFKTSEYGTPTSAGGTAVNDWDAPETVLIVRLRNVGDE